MLDTGAHATIEGLGWGEGRRTVICEPSPEAERLTLLAPEIVEAILDGRQPVALQLDGLWAGFPLVWKDQLGHRGSAEGLPNFRGRVIVVSYHQIETASNLCSKWRSRP
jgi:hypothetical protein